MENYLLFTVIATATILSPGPGVLLTLSNSLRYGVSGSIGGIVGISAGTFIVAGISATSLGFVLATSALAFSVIKFIGAAYLIYLGIKLWRSPHVEIRNERKSSKGLKLRFTEGLVLQLTNPKAIVFFLSIFPQFVSNKSDYVAQFWLLVATYSCLVLIIHLGYSYLAKTSRHWLSSGNGGKAINRTGGGVFVLFGIGLATSNK